MQIIITTNNAKIINFHYFFFHRYSSTIILIKLIIIKQIMIFKDFLKGKSLEMLIISKEEQIPLIFISFLLVVTFIIKYLLNL